MAGTIGEVSAKVTIDQTEIAATIRGLKAIQREARKAAGALRELELADKSAWTFQLGIMIRFDAMAYRCICADPETAVFALTYRTSDGWHTVYEDMITLPNMPELHDSIAENYRVIEAVSADE